MIKPLRVLIILGFWLQVGSFQAAGGPNVYFGNLHSHTRYSDGSGTPADAYRYARDTGHLDFLAVTEHNHSKAEFGIGNDDPRKDGILIAKDHSLYKGSQQFSLISAAKRYNKDNEFVAIYGQEFSTISSGNHVNIFEIDQVIDESSIPSGDFGALVNLLDSTKDSQNLPPIMQFNHPSKEFRDDSTEYGLDDFDSVPERLRRLSPYVRLIEVLNGPGTINQTGQTPTVTQADYLDYLDAGFKVGPSGDQDNHWKNWGRSTEARTGVIADALTKPKILEALRNRHVYATQDKNLKVIFLVNGHLCGDVVAPPPAGSALNITYSLVDADEPEASYKIEVFSGMPGGGRATAIEAVTTEGNNAPDHPKSIEDVAFTEEHQYVFFKIRQRGEDDNADHVWTAPVWFEATAPVPVVVETPPAGDFVASKKSTIYHHASCRFAAGIKPANKVTAAEATRGRTLHEGCPIE